MTDQDEAQKFIADLLFRVGKLEQHVAALEGTVLSMTQAHDWLRDQARHNQEVRALFQELLDRLKGGGRDEVGDAIRRLIDEREEGD